MGRVTKIFFTSIDVNLKEKIFNMSEKCILNVCYTHGIIINKKITMQNIVSRKTTTVNIKLFNRILFFVNK